MFKRLILAMTLLMAITLTVSAAPLNIASTSGSSISFGGNDDFQFIAGAGTTPYSFTVSSCDGCLGHISGNFIIGTIVTNGPVQEATVTGAGTLTIDDGTDVLTASLDLVDIFTLGTGGGTNISGVLNTTGVTYSGSEQVLLDLLTGATTVLSFQFTQPTNLTFLASNQVSTSFSGSIESAAVVIPEPATMGLVGGLLLAAGLARRKLISRR